MLLHKVDALRAVCPRRYAALLRDRQAGGSPLLADRGAAQLDVLARLLQASRKRSSARPRWRWPRAVLVARRGRRSPALGKAVSCSVKAGRQLRPCSGGEKRRLRVHEVDVRRRSLE